MQSASIKSRLGVNEDCLGPVGKLHVLPYLKPYKTHSK